MKQRSNPLDWMDIYPGELSVDEFPDGSFRFTVLRTDEVFHSNTVAASYHLTLKSTLPEAIIAVYQVCHAIRVAFPNATISLDVQTFPDQRADRVEAPGMTNAAHVSAHLIAMLPVDFLTVHDLHSPVTRTQLEITCSARGVELEVYEPIDDFVDTLYDVFPDEVTPQFDWVVAVDKGAIERAKQVSAHFGSGIIYCDKKRIDGKVVGHVLDGTPDWPVRADQTIWIVDDLCDGGATFISVAKLLRERFTFGDLNLYVTHGLFSKGKEELFQHYNHILARFDYSEVK